MPASLRSFTDAAADAVARSIATIEREAKRERELREAQFSARMAELESRIASVSEIERRLTERLDSLKDGEPGRDGRDGVDGSHGQDGKDGRDGASVTVDEIEPMIREAAAVTARETAETILATWDRPSNGIDGKDGRDGLDGAPGADGRDGVDGKDGERGPEGPAAKLPVVREWADGVHYEGTVVSHAGSLYQAIRDTGKEPGHEDWVCIVERGRDGVDGRSFTIRETWKEDGEYLALDVVALNGASFAARYDNPGPCPGEGWQIMSMQGKRGAPGEPGKPGQRGETGHVRAIAAMRADDNGLLTIVNADGTTVECDLYPVLSRLG